MNCIKEAKMLYDLTKLKTFIIVIREKSFSKASMKLGISQPAITQQIKYLESYFNTKLIVRKKSGVSLTKEGEKIFNIALKIERNLCAYRREFVHNIRYNNTIEIVCSPVIEKFILPKIFPKLTREIYPKIHYYAADSLRAIEDLQDSCKENTKIALVESPIFKENIIYREWLEDEIVLVSTKPLPRIIKVENLFSYEWVDLILGDGEFTAIKNYLSKLDINTNNFNVVAQFETYEKIKEFLFQESKEKNYMTFLPYLHIKEELQNKTLYYTKIRGLNLKRKIYLAVLKDDRSHSMIENICDFLMFDTKISLY